MRKKQTLALLAMFLFGAVALFIFELNKGPAWSPASVDATVRRTVSTDHKIRIAETQFLPGEILGNRRPLLNNLSHALRDRPLYRDIRKYLLQIGSDRVWIIIYQTKDVVDSVDIDPESPPSILAERLRSDFAAAHPGLPCSITKH